METLFTRMVELLRSRYQFALALHGDDAIKATIWLWKNTTAGPAVWDAVFGEGSYKEWMELVFERS